jgi:23S rRNA-/tRNA-specific pseudouridylate synthase
LAFQKQLLRLQVEKTYYAKVAHHLLVQSQTIDAPLRGDLDRRPYQVKTDLLPHIITIDTNVII